MDNSYGGSRFSQFFKRNSIAESAPAKEPEKSDNAASKEVEKVQDPPKPQLNAGSVDGKTRLVW